MRSGRRRRGCLLWTIKGRAFLRAKRRTLPWWFKLRAEERVFEKYCAALWEEIRGIADGLGVRWSGRCWRSAMTGYALPTGGCSAVMTGAVYGRNYDFKPRRYWCALRAGAGELEHYASIGASEQLTGRLDGMNERGLVDRPSPRTDSARVFPGSVCVADSAVLVLDQCATTTDAVAHAARKLPHAMEVQLLAAGCERRCGGGGGRPGCVAVRTDRVARLHQPLSSRRLLRPLNRRAANSQQRLPPLESWAARGPGCADACSRR